MVSNFLMILPTAVTDIIMLRAWYTITPRKFYNPITSLLLSAKDSWSHTLGMRLTGTVRLAQGIPTPLRADSTYKKVERPERRFNPLVVPRKLQAALPYASKPKLVKTQKAKGKEGGKGQTYLQRRAVVLEPEEKKAVALLQQMRALRKEKIQKRKEKKAKASDERKKKLEKEEKRKEEKEKDKKKDVMRTLGMKSKREEEGGGRYKRRKKT